MRCWARVFVVVLFIAGPAIAAPPPVEAYGHLPGIESIALSPEGDRVAFIGVSGDARRIFVRQIDGPMLMAAPVGEAKVRSLAWVGNDHLLIFSTETATASGDQSEKGEYATLVVANLKTRQLTAPLNDAGFFPGVEGYYGAREIGARWYAFLGLQRIARNEPRQGYSDLYRLGLDGFEALRVAKGSQLGRTWVIGDTGEVVAEEEYESETGKTTVYAGADRAKRLASIRSDSDGLGLEGLGRAPGTVLVSGLHGEGLNPQEVDVATGAAGGFLPPALHGSELLRSNQTHRVIGYQVFGEHPHVVMFDPVLNAKLQRAVKPFSDARAVLLSASDDYDRLIIHTEGDIDSGSYYLVDMKSRRADPLGYDYPPVGSADVGSRRMVPYLAADGTPLEGVLTLPPGKTAKDLPVIVLPHGGPRAHDQVAFDWWAEAFASRGYAVFQPNFRGSTGYGPEMLKAGYGQWGRKMQTDITDGLMALAARGVVDPKRACIVGASYGGYAALAGVTVQTGFYRCAVSVAGVSDLNAMLEWVSSRAGFQQNAASRYWNVAMGATGPNDSALREISPAHLAARADAPVLLIFGKDDTVVPNDQSTSMARALRTFGKPVEVMVMDHEDHWLSREASRTQMLKTADAFVRKYNPPD